MPWVGEVPAILEMYLAGDGVGEATISLLFGNTNPSGKLAETFPLRLEDNPSYLNFPGVKGIVEYHEGIFCSGTVIMIRKKWMFCFRLGMD